MLQATRQRGSERQNEVLSGSGQHAFAMLLRGDQMSSRPSHASGWTLSRLSAHASASLNRPGFHPKSGGTQTHSEQTPQGQQRKIGCSPALAPSPLQPHLQTLRQAQEHVLDW